MVPVFPLFSTEH